MSKYIITPWRTQADLYEVRQQLYRLNQDGVDRRRHAVDRVLAWKLRGGNLPHAVESTALLIDAALHHHAAPDVSLYSVRAVYTAAFSRFVTGFCDIGRARERLLEPSSMLDIARQIGMPPEFVALRHEATHEDLPGLRRLVAAVDQALGWLWQVYWSKLDNNTGREKHSTFNDADASASREEMVTKLKEFRKCRLDALRQQSASKNKRTDVKAEELGRDCIGLCTSDSDGDSLDKTKVQTMVSALVDEKLVLPSSRELRSSMAGAFIIWDGLIAQMTASYPPFPKLLVEGLLRSLDLTALGNHDSDKDPNQEGRVLWLTHLLQTIPSNFHTSLQTDVMRWCCLHPGHWSLQLGQAVVDDGSDEFAGDWQDLLTASALSEPVAAERSREQTQVFGVEADEELEHQTTGGWRRAAIRPTGPIGVV